MSTLDELFDRHGGRLQTLDDGIVGEVIGVAQAVGELRQSLDKLQRLLDERQFEKASDLGYRDIGSNFIFLQRTLAGLQSADRDVAEFVSDIAGELKCAYKDIETDVKSRMFCYHPRAEIADDEAVEWKRENAQAIEGSNEWLDENGLPLGKHRPS